jgi:uncharacterized membrane protein
MQSVRHGRYVVFLLLLVVLTGVCSLALSLDAAFALAFDCAAIGFMLSIIPHWSEGAPQTIRDQAVRDVGGRFAILLLTLIILGAVLVAVGSLIGGQDQGSTLRKALSIATLILAWIFANLVMAYHYAHRFYDQDHGGQDHGGLEFPGTPTPCFADFVNFSVVLGMTCQTADIAITRAAIRRMTTMHGVVAFFFNLGILAFAVNVVASTF